MMMRKLTPLSGGGDVDIDVSGTTSSCWRSGSRSSASGLTFCISSWNLNPELTGTSDLSLPSSNGEGSMPPGGSDRPGSVAVVSLGLRRSREHGAVDGDCDLASSSSAAIVSGPKRENMSSRTSRWNRRNTKQSTPEHIITGHPTLGLQSTFGTQSAVKMASENPRWHSPHSAPTRLERQSSMRWQSLALAQQ